MTWDTELLYSKRDVDVEGWRQFFPFVGSDVNVFSEPSFG
jgi:iron complex outermembrane receptor protein